MIGAVDVGVDRGGLHAAHEFRGDEEVVDAPADVTVARAGELVPIGVCVFGMRVEMTEGVYVAGGDDLVYPRALFGEEAGILFILLRPGEVYLFVRRVHVAAEDNRLLLT